MTADRNLLFGILALQMDYIGRDALVAAMNAWVLAKDRPLGEILVEQQALTRERRALLDAVVDDHLGHHDNDAEKSLAAVSSARLLRSDLERILDPDVHASLTHLSDPSLVSESEITHTYAASQPFTPDERFRILRPHARGGLGEVFVAEDQELHREVALKEIQARKADDPQHRHRFLLEAQITGGLEHPGIVPVYGLGTHRDGRPFYAMRLIRGQTLQSAIENYHQSSGDSRSAAVRALEFLNLLRRFVDVCNAVEYAHSRGILHRDLKPGNVMLGKYGETLVVDWGLAKRIDRPDSKSSTDEALFDLSTISGSGSGTETQMGSAVGTPQYMSPEQASGRLDLLGPATDVYCLGATLYCILTGQSPFAGGVGGGGEHLLQRVERGDFARPRQIKHDVPRPLEAICLKAMARDPVERYLSARDLARDIEAWTADQRVAAYGESRGERVARWLRHHRTAARAFLFSGLAIGIAVMAATILVAQQRELAGEQRRQASLHATEAAAARDVAQTHRYYALLNQARDLRNLRRMGWTWSAMNNLAEAATIGTSNRDPVELRAEVASALAGIDLREAGTLAEQVDPHCLAFSPDGRRLAMGNSRSLAIVSVLLYDVETQQKLQTLQFPSSLAGMLASRKPDGVAAITFTPDGRWLLVGARSGAIHAWDLSAKPPRRHTWQASDSPIRSLAAAPDSVRAFSATEAGDVKLWQIPSQGDPVATLRTTEAYSICVHPDGKTAFCAMPKLLPLDSATLQPTDRWPAALEGVTRCSLSPSGELLAADMYFGRELRLISTASGQTVRILADREIDSAHDGGTTNMQFSPDGALLMTAASDARLKIWDVASGNLLCAVTLSGMVFPTFDPAGGRLATTAQGKVLKFDLAGNTVHSTLAQHEGRVRAIDISPSREQLICLAEGGANSGTLSRWQVESGALVSSHRVPDQVDALSGITVARNDEFLALTCQDRRMHLWHVGEHAPQAQLEVSEPRGLTFAPDGRRLWCGIASKERLLSSSSVGRVASWSVPDLKPVSEWSNSYSAIKEGVSGITALAAGENHIVAGSSDGTLKLLDARSGELADTIPLAAGRLLCVAISHQEAFVAAGTERGTLALVRLQDQHLVTLPQAHADQVTAVDFSHDARFLASASRDREIRLWKVGAEGLTALVNLRGEAGPVSAVRFDAQDRKLFYLGLNETAVRVWHLDRLRAALHKMGLDWE